MLPPSLSLSLSPSLSLSLFLSYTLFWLTERWGCVSQIGFTPLAWLAFRSSLTFRGALSSPGSRSPTAIHHQPSMSIANLLECAISCIFSHYIIESLSFISLHLHLSCCKLKFTFSVQTLKKKFVESTKLECHAIVICCQSTQIVN